MFRDACLSSKTLGRGKGGATWEGSGNWSCPCSQSCSDDTSVHFVVIIKVSFLFGALIYMHSISQFKNDQNRSYLRNFPVSQKLFPN